MSGRNGSRAQNEGTLWGTLVSPYVRKVKNVLDFKGVSYRHEEILPTVLLQATGQEVPFDFEQASPLGKIPAFQIGELCAADSAVIVGFLERQFPERSVYPKDSSEFLNALWFEKYSDTVLSEVIHPIFVERVVKPAVLGVAADEEMVRTLIEQRLPTVLHYLDHYLSGRDTFALAGEELSLADFSVVHHLVDLDVANVDWRTGTWSAVEAYLNRMLDQEVIRAAIPKMFRAMA